MILDSQHSSDAEGLRRITQIRWMRRRVLDSYQRRGKRMPERMSVCAFFWTAVASVALSAAKAALSGPRIGDITLPLVPLALVGGLGGMLAWKSQGDNPVVVGGIALASAYLYVVFPVMRRRLDFIKAVDRQHFPRLSLRGLRRWQVVALAPAMIVLAVPFLPLVTSFWAVYVMATKIEELCERWRIYDPTTVSSNRYIWRSRLMLVVPLASFVSMFALGQVPYAGFFLALASILATIAFSLALMGRWISYWEARYVFKFLSSPEARELIKSTAIGEKAEDFRRQHGLLIELQVPADQIMSRIISYRRAAEAVSELCSAKKAHRAGIGAFIAAAFAAAKGTVCPVVETKELVR